MTKNHENNPQNNDEFFDPKIDYELVEIVSKIFNRNPKEVTKVFLLFINVDLVTRNALYFLSKMDEKQKLNASIALEYLFRYNRSIVDLMDEKV